MNPTTVWSALAVAQQVVGGITWIDPNDFQPKVDALNLYWDSVNVRLSVKTAGDYSGTDAVNAGSQYDSYVPNGFAIGTVGAPPAYGVSTSRGSRLAPTISLAGDPIGSFGAYAYLGDGVIVGKAYFEMASVRAYLAGVHATYPGGELRVGSKLDNGAYVEYYKLVDKDGHISPIVTGTTKLGLASKGWAAFYLDYSHAGAAGNIAIQKPAGSVLIAAGQQSVVLTNALITASSIVMVTVATDDATAKSAIAVPAAGSATIKLNAVATAQTKVVFQVIGAD